MRPAMLVLATALIVTRAHAQADSASDVFHKVNDSTHTSTSGNDVFRRAAQAKEAAQNRPDVIATDPNQVEAQVVRRDSIAILHRAPASQAAPAPEPAPAAPAAPVSPAVAALGAAFTAAGPPEDPQPTVAVAPKAHRAPVANTSTAHKAPPAERAAPPVEHASVVASGAAPIPTRMGALPAPATPANPVFNDTVSTLEREAATVSQDVAPKYATEKVTIDSVRDAHNAKLDSLEATETAVHDSTERRFLHKMAEAARLKSNAPHKDTTAKQH